jgi:hypothetical protein
LSTDNRSGNNFWSTTYHNNNITKCTAPEIGQTIQNNFNKHILLIYEDLETFREAYARIVQSIFNNSNADEDSILLLPYLESAETVMRYLQENEVDVSSARRTGNLTVIDSVKWFLTNKTDPNRLLEDMTSIIKAQNKKSATIIRDLGCFFLGEKVNELVGMEISFPESARSVLTTICCIHGEDFERFNAQQKDALIKHHQCVLYVTNAANIIFEVALAESLDEAMKVFGKHISDIVIRHIHAEYPNQAELLGSNPSVLSDALNTALDSGSRIVERRILRSLYKKIGMSIPEIDSSNKDFHQKFTEARELFQRTKAQRLKQ